MILGSNGQDKHATRHSWGSSGPWCGLDSEEALLKNQQAIWFVKKEGNQHVITPASHETECMILGSNGQDKHATRYRWGSSGPWCGLDSKEALLKNQQAIWSIVEYKPNQFKVKHAMLPDECLILSGDKWGLGSCAHKLDIWKFEKLD